MSTIPRNAKGEIILHYRNDRHRFDRVFHRFPVIPSLTAYLRRECRGKRVLNVGCVGARKLKQKSCEVNELHHNLSEVTPHLAGLDCDEEGVAVLKQAGFDVHCADACDPSLGIENNSLDAVVAVHLIEHLPNPGLFLQNVQRWLVPAGKLLLVTENPFFLNQTFKVLKYGSPMIHEEHCCLFDPITIARIFALSRFSLQDFFWIAPNRPRLQNLLLPLRPYWSQEFLAVGAVNDA